LGNFCFFHYNDTIPSFFFSFFLCNFSLKKRDVMAGAAAVILDNHPKKANGQHRNLNP
jgi:hypothetical protein